VRDLTRSERHVSSYRKRHVSAYADNAIPSERRLVEQLRYNLLLRWFVGLPLDQPLFHVTSFTKNRDRLLNAEIAEAFFSAIRGQAEAHKLLSREHFSVDGTLLEAAAALKSLRPIEEVEGEEPPSGGDGRNPDVDWRGERRGNASHRSTTDPEARLARKGSGKEAKLCYAGHTLIENRHGLIVDLELTQASGTAEREAGLRLLAKERSRRGRGRMSVAADKGYDVADFVAGVRKLRITPHVARKKRYSAIDGRTTRHEGYGISLRRRKRIEEGYGWMKDVGGLRKLRHRGAAKVAAIFTFNCAAYNLVRLRSLLAEPALT
jgi:IS5 family transposase